MAILFAIVLIPALLALSYLFTTAVVWAILYFVAMLGYTVDLNIWILGAATWLVMFLLRGIFK